MTGGAVAKHLDADIVAAYQAELLDPRERASVAQHLSSCHPCQALSVRLTQLQQTLRRIPAAPLPADVAARLDAALRQAAMQRDHREAATTVTAIPWWRRYVAPTTAAAAAAVLAGVVLVTPQSRPPGSKTEDASALAQDAAGADSSRADSGHSLPRLSAASFRHDVSRLVGTAALTPPASDQSHGDVSTEPLGRSGCWHPQSAGRGWKVLVDGHPALLVLRPAARGPREVAIAYSCGENADGVAARARLPRR